MGEARGVVLGQGYRISGYHAADSKGPWLIIVGPGIGRNVATVWLSRDDAETIVKALNDRDEDSHG